MEAADSDGDGMIEYDSEEFVALLEELEDEPYDQVMEAFKYLDKDGDGLISSEELKRLVTSHGEPMTEVCKVEYTKQNILHFQAQVQIPYSPNQVQWIWGDLISVLLCKEKIS